MRLSRFAPRGPVAFVSTHLDDAVLSCGQAIADCAPAVVITVFTDAPTAPAGPWDQTTTGEQSGPSALSIRQEEDRRALGLLGARPVWLAFADGQYQPSIGLDDLVDALAASIAASDAASVVTPLGLRHADHLLVSDACRYVMRSSRAQWFLYQDLPYATEWPQLIPLRLREFDAEPLSPVAVRTSTKARAIAQYDTQVTALRRYISTFDNAIDVDERYWQVTS